MKLEINQNIHEIKIWIISKSFIIMESKTVNIQPDIAPIIGFFIPIMPETINAIRTMLLIQFTIPLQIKKFMT